VRPALRSTGIEVIGDVPWGTHFCQFYQDKHDLIDLLVPYFAAGLARNEFCMWITSDPLGVEEATAALAAVVGDVEHYLSAGQLEILDYRDWYTLGGAFDADRVLRGWVEKLTAAQGRGFDGLRLSGNTFWLEQADWQDFTEYEAAVDGVLGRYPMLALCTYSLEKCGAVEIMDVVSNHAFALIRRGQQWQVIESAERKKTEAALRQSEERYRSLFSGMTEGFALHEILCDAQGVPCDYRFLEINPAFERLTGLQRDAVVGRTVREIMPDTEPYWIEVYGKVALTGESIHFENISAALNRHYEVFAYRSAPGQFAVLFIDITDRKHHETELHKLNRTMRAISNSNQALMYATDEMSLLREVCNIIVRDCGHQMVWIGFAEDDVARSVRPVACAGFEEGYLETLQITWADTEHGRGPTGTSIRTGQPNICRNMLDDPRFAPWREQALKRGYASSIGVPLLADGKAMGAITIYSKEPDPFSEEEVTLLEELASDLAYGIGMIRLRVSHAQAEAALQKSERRVRQKLSSILSPEGDIGHLALDDIIDVAAVQSLMDDFYALAGIPMALIDLQGKVLVGVGWQDICTQFHRVHPETCAFCIESDTILTRDVPPDECRLYRCKNHMWDIATPLIVGEQRFGNIFAGQFFFADETPDYDFFRAQARRYGFAEEDYLAALDAVPRLSREQVDFGMAFLTKLGRMLSQLSYSNIKLARTLEEQKRSEDALRDNREWLRVTLTSIGDAVIAADTAGRITFLNTVAATLTGWSIADALGQPVQQVFRIMDEITHAPGEDIVARVLAARTIVELANHTALLSNDGRQIPIEDSAAPITDTAGNVTGVVLVFHDVTEKRRAQEAREQLLAEVQRRIAELEATFASMADGIVIYTADGAIEYANELAEQVLGFTREVRALPYRSRLEALRLETIDGRPFPVEDLPSYHALHQGETLRGRQIVIQRPQGKYWLSVSAAPIRTPDGQVLGAVMNFTDITPLHELQEQQKTLLHLVSHDLRSPLTIIKGYASLLESSMEESSVNDLVRNGFAAIQRGVKRMDVMIEDLVEVARLEGRQAELKWQPVELSDYVADLLTRAGQAMEVARITTAFPPDLPSVNADADRLERILLNLLTNALKYAEAGTPVLLRAARREREVVISVSDQGSGIEPDELSHLFERFYRASGSRKAEGIGLGLYITRLLVEAHGGQIWADSLVGQGSTFSFTLPITE
jgi:PAS domain S-box-containing protein